ncbi:ComF family protein [Candidatus Dependentiae bacterium]|nr:ComF family protein [Candidatus Dependentiae bacterium]
MAIIKNLLINNLRQLIAPPFCTYCGIILFENAWWCAQCASHIKPVVSKTMEVTKSFHMPVFAAGVYEEPLKSLILAKSWSSRVASVQLGEFIWQRTSISVLDFDYIVPVPLHWRRYAWRGYNQAEVMAQTISKFSGKPIAQIVKRKRSTPYLSSKKIHERSEIIRDAFAPIGDLKKYDGATLLLIDDLLTTGATLHAVARTILYGCKPKALYGAVAARVI